MFLPQTLNVIFEKIPENESGDACQTIQVNVLDCDTIGQTKEKSLQAFLNKNGFLYGLQMDEIGLGKCVTVLYFQRLHRQRLRSWGCWLMRGST